MRTLPRSRRPFRVGATATAVLAGWTALLLVGCFGMPRSLRVRGVSASATILEIWDTGWTVNDDPVIGMRVRVYPADRPSYEARIEKTPVSRIAVSQFQPGATVPVRFDPQDPAVVAVDFTAPADTPAASAPAAAATGNPFRDRFVAGSPAGSAFLPPPAEPELFLGTADSAADTLGLIENGYVPLGAAAVEHRPDPALARDAGRALGAAVVVVYGHFDPPPGSPLAVLPYRPSAGAAALRDAETMALVSGFGPGQQIATYWGRTKPGILGVFARALTAEEGQALGHSGGAVIDGIAAGSPAAAAHLLTGDVIVAIDGEEVADHAGLKRRLDALAGRTVHVALLRDGKPLTIDVALGSP